MMALFLIVKTSFCQSFMHGVGITAIGTNQGRTSKNSVEMGGGFAYSPRMNFYQNENLSVSVGIPLSLGISASTSSTTDQYGDYTSAVGIWFNLPVIVNLNMERGSTKSNRKKFGYFVGAGFAYHHGDFVTDGIYDPVTDTYTETYSSNAFGPAGNAGVRLGVGKKHKNIEIKLSFMKALNETKPNIFGLAGLFNF